MKKLYILICIVALSFFSCNDWLDVTPKSEIKSETLYKSEDGYKEALNGVYIKMASADMYGEDASMYYLDGLARMWTIPTTTTSTLYELSNHQYTNSSVESAISNLFMNYYNAIAQLNDILDNLNNSTVKFSYDNDKLIKGEALGLRAFLHLDLLRLFGPVPSEANDSVKTIPYVTEITNENSKLTSKSWKEVTSDIESDLLQSANLLKKYDPIVRTTIDSLKNTSFMGKGNIPNDSWQLLRQGRFNYYAVLGTLARFYHWIGNNSKAIQCAKMVIDSGKFQLYNEVSFSGSDASLDMYSEHLFGLENPNQQTILEPIFKGETPLLTQTSDYTDAAYESSIHVNDIRYANHRYWEVTTYQNSTKVNHFYKYTGNNNITTDNRVPLLRYVEMYFILIEDLPLAEAKNYFIKYRQSRALSSTIDETSTSDEVSLLSRLEKEYRKEFYGEGQMFFFYKKHNYDHFTWPTNYTVPSGAYDIPLPKDQINFE
ncbi:MAG: RagB/SusD family nutrient uptake outer membrane protein [Prevotella sp.]|jgi:hypothetical protein|nr:RagB/SusD family nutrient uptake outer membrane protein [Prevotella sp.]